MTTRNLALLLIGFMAGIASVKSYPMLTAPVQSAELETVWHDLAEVPTDDDAFTLWWNDLGNRAKRETLKHPREPLWFAGQLKTQGAQ